MEKKNEVKRICLAITGASGAQYALRLAECLASAGVELSLLLSSAARIVINTETNHTVPEGHAEQQAFFESILPANANVTLYSKEDWFAPVASGSSAPGAMVICPASGGTLSAIACGASNNLIERAADVALKERRSLILVPRESPYSEIHLENMLKLSRMGALILPASPGFYDKPESVDDLVDFVVARILDHLGVEQKLVNRWGAEVLTF
ncbi:MAG: 4-hydroxy-3-polyprenylbenzoate decarboxylase [Flavobacteriales bacterium]|jgi:4-hydroxy-3-polyprenylbenzoate decarboxylase